MTERWDNLSVFLDDLSESNGSLYNLRIFHEFEGGIGKFVPRITVWHHEVC